MILSNSRHSMGVKISLGDREFTPRVIRGGGNVLSATRAGKNIKRSAKRKRKRDSFKHCRAAAAEFLFLLFFFLVPLLAPPRLLSLSA